ncbi:MAG TPA: hypothetical protein PLC25_03160 [Bacilli bacterium]|nr:hypothetical protein [Bacilli bacterium]
MIGVNKDIFDFLCSTHSSGKSGFSEEGFKHYITILPIIKNKMFNPDQPESKFVELCVAENWEYAKAIADTRNKEAIEYCDLFRKFVEHIKKSPDYIQFKRDEQLTSLIDQKNSKNS